MTDASSTVLLVEDDQDDVILIRRAFEKGRVLNPIQVADDGEKAIRYLSGQEPYADRTRYPIPFLILLDLKLPIHNGHEVLEWLRRQPILRRIPVVVVTSSRETRDVNRAYDLGANSYLVKPVTFDALTEMVRSLSLFWIILSEKPTLEGENRDDEPNVA